MGVEVNTYNVFDNFTHQIGSIHASFKTFTTIHTTMPPTRIGRTAQASGERCDTSHTIVVQMCRPLDVSGYMVILYVNTFG